MNAFLQGIGTHPVRAFTVLIVMASIVCGGGMAGIFWIMGSDD